jgi:ATP-dependent Clp protease ATP-binding subunit ClpA
MPKVQRGPELTDDSKKILTLAAMEATYLVDYWIDTEHVLLGIMHVRQCAAASYLERTGLTLDAVRKSIRNKRHSRPDYGAASRWWLIKTRLAKLTLQTWAP